MTSPVLKNSKIVSLIDNVYEARKSSIKAAMAVGPFIGIVYLFGVHFLRILTLKQTAQILSRHLEVEMVPVLLEHPEIAVDIDTADDYAFVEEQISLQKDRPRPSP